MAVEFFGERTTLPGGPATLALRTGAPVLPSATYFEGRRHHAVIRPPLDVTRTGRFRDDVARVTQALAHELEDLIRAAPEQWHLLQPNWPSDELGDPSQRSWCELNGPERRSRRPPPHQGSALAASSSLRATLSPRRFHHRTSDSGHRPTNRKYRAGVRVGLVCPYSLTVPGGVQGQVLGLARALRASGHTVSVLGPCDGPPPDAGVTRWARASPPPPTARWRRSRPTSPPAAHDPGAAGRGVRRPPPPRAAGAGADADGDGVQERADGRHVPRRRRQRGVPLAQAARARWRPAPRPPVRGVRGRAEPWRSRRSAASTPCCSTASRCRGSPRRPRGRRTALPSSSSGATSPARAWPCCSTP